MFLLSYSFIEPEDSLHLYHPSWLNVWESHSYNNALKSTGANGWGFKRFGMLKETYARDAARNTNYIAYIDAMEKVADQALHGLSTKERMMLFKSRTAFIYVDSWGESGTFETKISALHSSVIDTLPKNLVKKFSVRDVTCKIRGEKTSLTHAMRMAQDYLEWDVFDFVVVCGGHRAVPLLTFTAENMQTGRSDARARSIPGINITIERVGCFVFSLRESALRINCGHYHEDVTSVLNREVTGTTHQLDIMGFTEKKLRRLSDPYYPRNALNLTDIYGYSGCLTPALSWDYISRQSLNQGCMRTILPDNSGGCNYFDTWY